MLTRATRIQRIVPAPLTAVHIGIGDVHALWILLQGIPSMAAAIQGTPEGIGCRSCLSRIARANRVTQQAAALALGEFGNARKQWHCQHSQVFDSPVITVSMQRNTTRETAMAFTVPLRPVPTQVDDRWTDNLTNQLASAACRG
jgi:hypothetical protein